MIARRELMLSTALAYRRLAATQARARTRLVASRRRSMPGSKRRPEADRLRPKALGPFRITGRPQARSQPPKGARRAPPQTAEAIEQAMGRARAE